VVTREIKHWNNFSVLFRT